MPDTINYESSALTFAAAALSASEGNYEDTLAVIEKYDGNLIPVAFGLAVLAGQTIVPANGMSGVLAVVQRLLNRPVVEPE